MGTNKHKDLRQLLQSKITRAGDLEKVMNLVDLLIKEDLDTEEDLCSVTKEDLYRLQASTGAAIALKRWFPCPQAPPPPQASTPPSVA
eukprot:CAMPEP_0202890132 /NCGR_PEP_ID=MMETSP1392-20130828/640_1 /ASSEMBLY_ACC=CAM_ASM_000868 /TAXON_ID=225041 /ORGANISM="Chlamydomonas chlamydogama, Strain SAG 11-48b" /LENGTH=87 /DNA_ID=CAMNT_0049573643 /DNA_START=153 /DNA_END=413 /DNA_ORIENTATION=+